MDNFFFFFFFALICPNSPSVWDGKGFSDCFQDIVLGFAVNVVTIAMILVLGIKQKISGRGTQRSDAQMSLLEKFVLYFVPAIGACCSVLEIMFLLKKEHDGHFVGYHRWLHSCSELLVWANIILFTKCASIHCIVFNRVLCFWWILNPILGIFHLITNFPSLEVSACIMESLVVLMNLSFGVVINVIRLKRLSSKSSLLEDPLLSNGGDLEEGGNHDLENNCNFWDFMTFKFISPVMNQGVLKQLDSDDLLPLLPDMGPSFCHDIILNSWRAQVSNNSLNPSLFSALCNAYGWPYLCLGLLKVINDGIGFAGPLLLNKLIKFLQQGSASWDGYLLALSLGLTSIIKSFLDTQYTFRLSKLKLKLRSSIMTLIYEKCLYVNLAERSKFTNGEIQTFMSVDADRTVNLCNSFHDMWSLPLQIGVALYLLYTQVKFAFVSGLAIAILLIPVNKWISTLIARATEQMMKEKDERIRRTGELLTYIRTLKMYGWELLFSSWLMATRSLEVKHLATRKYLDAWCVFFWATTPSLFSLSTFGLFALMGHQLDAATVFTCIALFNTLISPLNSFPWVINGLIDAIISSRRLSRFLSCPEHRREVGENSSCSSSFLSKQPDSLQDLAVFIQDACCSWSSGDEEAKNLVLNHVTLSLSKGSFVAVIGEVGSGKSSLIYSILGEMRLDHGSIYSHGSVAYVPQVPWVISGTVRDNILFGKSYNPERYADTINACALDVDISSMVGGDMAYIGEKGVNLSGGQRARLALARVLYHDSDVIMLDDILSAVDVQVAQWILHNAILGPLLKGKTRLLCTHNIQAISSADMTIVLDKGCVKWMGISSDFPTSLYTEFSPLNEMDSTPHNHQQSCSINSSISEEQSLPDRIVMDTLEGEEDVIEVELRKEGKVELGVYKNYAAFTGWFIAVIICLSALLMQASRNANDLWLSYWVDTTTEDGQTSYSMSFYLAILCLFCIMNSIFTLVRAFSFAFGGLQAATKVHNRLLSKLINAPVQFFDQTPGGRILNRLSSDLYTIDDSLPFILNILLANFVGLLGIAIILSYVQVFFLVLLLPFWYIYSRLQFFYRSTSRELRRLDSVSRSPIYTSFTETLDGSSTIRAFKSEDFFFSKFTDHITLYQKTSYTEIVASLWLSLRLQLLAAFIISFIALMAVAGSHGSLPINFGTPGLVGLALSYAAPIVSLLGSFLTSFTETEKEMVSIERALQYMDIPQEEQAGCQYLNPDWPNQGVIEFQHVTLKYMPSLPAALCNISFKIEGGTQVGIIGRTGAGKSSVLTALFRLTPICAGSITVDGMDIQNIPVRELRTHLAIVPQSPFLFEGSLRDNLDPFKTNDDSKIWDALEKCHVKEEVEAAGGLNVLVKEGGMSFSVGQRQLLCLARALLKSSKVLCLDECTASVDIQTASLLQSTISSECKGMTVITIAHRISTVINLDNILILDHGNLAEQGHPQILLKDGTSIFSSFVKASSM
ncbi:ABC transporter C family member 13 isoform X1 [Medicago truncatula]|uniref:ABC transporter C family member 13 isoform X1 n=1 Tax=Medicago truncatula TaxID=3880 RepID=UPI000D2F3BD9|nr:ABC transporter C family member 13 isoform X1 [Medicago truncatula]XP_039686865.1 ABC transporter C family member 13 isoform X1 [Medicago truncatula]